MAIKTWTYPTLSESSHGWLWVTEGAAGIGNVTDGMCWQGLP